MEIERRWLMDGFPDQTGPEAPVFLAEIEKAQGYLATAPVVRIRSEYTAAQDKWEHILCVKGQGTLAREEIETPLTADIFEKLAAFIGRPLITKRTRLYRLPAGHILECSLVDEGLPSAFYYAEVEFDSVEEATAFAAPNFLGPEKTMDRAFSMKSYWESTRGGH